MNDSFSRYCKAWRMWNSWLLANERPQISIEEFIELGFELMDNEHDYRHGYVCGYDTGDYYVEIGEEEIFIKFKEKPRYRWHPYVTGYGNLNKDEVACECENLNRELSEIHNRSEDI